jgi:hypothetical protein
VPLDEAYFLWLCSQVGLVETLKNKAKTYWALLRILYGKEFTWLPNINKDENRANDGKDLRLEFCRENNLDVDPDWMDMPCSVLEMLVALSFKLAWDSDGKQPEWFWVMIDNIGLTECTDVNPPNPDIVDEILDRVLNREYGRNGAGGLFPLQKAAKDQRKVELIYQAETYLLERL